MHVTGTLQIVYSRTNSQFSLFVGSLVGFVNLGKTNSHLQSYEKYLEGGKPEAKLADHMLVIMVRGLFSSLEFPYAQFPCNDLSGEQMYTIVWEAVGRLEQVGFKVMALVCDGLAANRRLFKLHNFGSPIPQ